MIGGTEQRSVAAQPGLPRLILHETTLREGMQAPPVTFTADDKVEIAQLLDEIGVPQIQVGYGSEDRAAISAMKRSGVRAKLSVLVPAFRDDWKQRVEVAADAGADIILVLYRASDRQLELLGRSRAQAIDELAAAVAHVRANTDTAVAANASFATKADPDFLVELLGTAHQAGARRLGVADSPGVATPEHMAHLVRAVKERAGDADISVHTHNDFGLAVANAIAGWQAGATIADVSVLGLGERAGNAPLEQVVVALDLLYGVETGIDLAGLNRVVRRVAEIANVPIPAQQPIVGDDVFAQKLEMHVQVTARHPELHEPFAPDLVGRERVLKLGSGSGKVAVTTKLRELGIEVDPREVEELVVWVHEEALRRRSEVPDDVFADKSRSLGDRDLS